MANKHLKQSFDTDPDSDSDIIVQSWPRFLIVESTDPLSPLNKISPFALNKGIQGLAGTPKTVKLLRSGALLVEVSKEVHAKNLLKATTLAQCPVKATAHKTLNSCRGVIRCPDIKNCSDEEILENLSSQGVTYIRRITVLREGERKATGTFIVTFAGSTLPSHLKVGYLSVRVDTYIPNPMRCFKCQKYGHFSNYCKHSEVCEKCAQPKHDGTCSQQICCINCQGDHPASSRNCPIWKQEKEIQSLKAKCNISYMEAKKRLAMVTPQGGTYAAKVSIVKKTTTEISTQTDLTWKTGDLPVTMPPVSHNPPARIITASVPVIRQKTMAQQTTETIVQNKKDVEKSKDSPKTSTSKSESESKTQKTQKKLEKSPKASTSNSVTKPTALEGQASSKTPEPSTPVKLTNKERKRLNREKKESCLKRTQVLRPFSLQ